MITLEELQKNGEKRLKDRIPTASLDSRLLLQFVTGCEENEFYSHPLIGVSRVQYRRFNRLVEDRRTGAPLAHLTGRKEFWSLSFEVSRSTLIPRPETELLIERVLVCPIKAGAIAEIGTGAGNIAAVVARERPQAEITATDISRRALRIARRNLEKLGIPNVRLLHGSLYHPFQDLGPEVRFDCILSNPPYISEDEWNNLSSEVRDYEPKRALVSGPTGLEIISKLIIGAPDFLKSGGFLIFEIGFGQREQVISLFSDSWSSVTSHSDLAGIPRVIQAQLS